ncbi:unnamed protein product [Brassica rapa]|uniref:Uncharacterized protein n=1 Tax=Brassica campestris TaxID=3711 RepID=A0A8D9G649_BRACM|nr:unnamed protein product [Brassica rapa]
MISIQIIILLFLCFGLEKNQVCTCISILLSFAATFFVLPLC